MLEKLQTQDCHFLKTSFVPNFLVTIDFYKLWVLNDEIIGKISKNSVFLKSEKYIWQFSIFDAVHIYNVKVLLLYSANICNFYYIYIYFGILMNSLFFYFGNSIIRAWLMKNMI